MVRTAGATIDVPNLAPHDLRRTFAKLAHKGRAAPEQIQLSLDHASVTTTERYLGVRQNLTDASCDHLGITVERDDVPQGLYYTSGRPPSRHDHAKTCSPAEKSGCKLAPDREGAWDRNRNRHASVQGDWWKPSQYSGRTSTSRAPGRALS